MLANKKLALVLALFTIFLFSGCESPSLLGKKVEKKYYTGGQLMSEFIWSDSSGHNGALKLYGFDGKQVSSVNITNGVKNGIETHFDNKSRVIRQIPYVNGKIHGVDKIFYPNGDRKITYTYKYGMKEGYAYAYYPDGSIAKKAIYRRGRLAN